MAAPPPWHAGMHAGAAQVDYGQRAATYATECWPTIDSYYNLRDLVTLTPDLSVLDVGCGIGHMGVLASLKQNSADNVYFVDPSSAMVGEAFKNMRGIWGNPVMADLADHFVATWITMSSTHRRLLEAFGKPQGFDVIFAKNFVCQFRENARIAVVAGLTSLLADTGQLVCDIPQPAISRHIIYPDDGELTCLGVRTMSMAAAGALPTDLSTLRNGVAFATTRFDVLVRREDVDRAKREVGELVAAADCVVRRMDESFGATGPTSHNNSIWERAITRTTLQEHPVKVRVDVQRREWVRGTLSRPPLWGHRAIQLPLSTDVVVAKLATRSLSGVESLPLRSEARALNREWKNR